MPIKAHNKFLNFSQLGEIKFSSLAKRGIGVIASRGEGYILFYYIMAVVFLGGGGSLESPPRLPGKNLTALIKRRVIDGEIET